MAVIPIGFGQINYVFRGTGVPTGAEITLGFENNSASQDPAVLAGQAEAAVGAIFAQLTDEIGLDKVVVKLGPNATGPQGEVTGTWEGLASGETVAPNTAALVKKGTALGGRQGRGRMYIPGIPENEVTGAGTLDGTFLDALQASVEFWMTELAGDGMNPALLRGPNSPALPPEEITSFSVDSKVATQRRRLRR